MKSRFRFHLALVLLGLAVATSACKTKTEGPPPSKASAVTEATPPPSPPPQVVPAPPLDQVKPHAAVPADAIAIEELTAEEGLLRSRYCFAHANVPEVVDAVSKSLAAAGWEVGTPVGTTGLNVTGLTGRRDAVAVTIRIGWDLDADLDAKCGAADKRVQVYYTFTRR